MEASGRNALYNKATGLLDTKTAAHNDGDKSAINKPMQKNRFMFTQLDPVLKEITITYPQILMENAHPYTMTTLIQAHNISFTSDSRTILNNVSMQLSSEEILTIIGPNGAGKTTLLRILIGLMKPSAGKVEYSHPLVFGYMPQNLQLNSAMPLPVSTFLNCHKNQSGHLQQILQELTIEHLLHYSMHQLSGGEKQRVLLARAMLRQPDVLVLDEPAQGVDISGQQRFYALIDKVREAHHCAVLMVSHDLHWVMAQTDRVICLNQHICCHGHPDDVSNDQAYLNLFGNSVPANLAPYTHHHNHHHDLHGSVIVGEHSENCQHDH